MVKVHIEFSTKYFLTNCRSCDRLFRGVTRDPGLFKDSALLALTAPKWLFSLSVLRFYLNFLFFLFLNAWFVCIYCYCGEHTWTNIWNLSSSTAPHQHLSVWLGSVIMKWMCLFWFDLQKAVLYLHFSARQWMLQQKYMAQNRTLFQGQRMAAARMRERFLDICALLLLTLLWQMYFYFINSALSLQSPISVKFTQLLLVSCLSPSGLWLPVSLSLRIPVLYHYTFSFPFFRQLYDCSLSLHVIGRCTPNKLLSMSA